MPKSVMAIQKTITAKETVIIRNILHPEIMFLP